MAGATSGPPRAMLSIAKKGLAACAAVAVSQASVAMQQSWDVERRMILGRRKGAGGSLLWGSSRPE